MDKRQQATYMAEKSLDYKSTGVTPIFSWHNRLILASVFGFAAALLETFPIVGILFRCAILQTQSIDHLPDRLQRFEPGRRCHVGPW